MEAALLERNDRPGGLLARLTTRQLQFICPECGAEEEVSCETFNNYFQKSYAASCSTCSWMGHCQPFKAVDLSCPRCSKTWPAVRVDVAGKSWLEFLAAAFFCETCQAEVQAVPCQTMSFWCGDVKCRKEQAILCDPWTEEGPATVRCYKCPWAGVASLLKRR
ncbi:unnamed protein product [Effrenium voratum]|nr:unnamed protein product [Effrenium voratum]